MNRRLGKFAEGEEEMKSHLRRAIAAKKAKQIHLSFSFSCKKLQKADTKDARQLQQFYANFGFCHSREAFTAKKCKTNYFPNRFHKKRNSTDFFTNMSFFHNFVRARKM